MFLNLADLFSDMVSDSSRRVLTVLTLALINVAAVMNLSQLSILAQTGLAAISFLAIAGIAFFIPTALASAELASAYPKKGGIYAWVKEAFGKNWGFFAIWLQWVENVFWYPTVLSFAVATIAFIIDPHLATNTLYTFITILFITWTVTLANFRGMKLSGKISSIGVTVGMMFPAALIIFLGILWLLLGKGSEIEFTTSALLPDFGNINNLVLLLGAMLGLCGIEMSAVHVNSVKDPKKNFPKAIFLSAGLILGIFALGALAIAVVVPQKQILLSAGIMDAFSAFFSAFGIAWALPIIALFVALGSIGTISTWIIGPSKGLLATAEDGTLPPFFQRTNSQGVPTNLLLMQAGIITFLVVVYLFMPSINSFYWMLTALTAQLYLIMYVLMFAALIKLRYSQPNIKRPYSLPGGKVGMWLIAGLGILASVSGILLGFIPPSQINTGSGMFFQLFIVGAIVTTGIVALIILRLKKPSWVPKSAGVKPKSRTIRKNR